VLGAMFVGLSIVMAAIAGATRETSLSNLAAPIEQPGAAAPAAPAANEAEPAANSTSNEQAPLVPLAQ
jgi:hypothetical protein